MTIKLLFFATLRDHVGVKTLDLDLPPGSTVLALKESLLKIYPRLRLSENSILTAVNGEYAADQDVIPDDAEIGMFPPVSGG
jgi:molybdopterin converting factor subunit 1